MAELSALQFALLGMITFFAALAQSITGFGFALITLPFYVLILEVKSAVQLTLIATFIIALMLLPSVYRHSPRKTCAQLILSAMIGFPLGLYFLNVATRSSIQIFIGLAILIALLIPYLSPKKTDAVERQNNIFVTGLYGFVSGVMTTSIAMPGPALAFYANKHAMQKQATRAMIFMVFVFLYGFAILQQTLSYGFYGSTLETLPYALIPAIVGTYIGNKVSGNISDKLFRQLITFILIVTASYLLLSNIVILNA